MRIREDVISQVIREIESLKRWRSKVIASEYGQFKGNSAADFTTAILTEHGDYGYQTTKAVLQFNCNGAIRQGNTTAV
jgi:hypothetical protein